MDEKKLFCCSLFLIWFVITCSNFKSRYALSPVATLHQDVPRKLLRRPTENGSRNDYDPCGRIGLNENNQDTGDSSEKQDHLLAVPGVILLCCGLMFPCFHAERKEVSRHDTATAQRNAGEFIFCAIFQPILFLLPAPSLF